MTQLAMDLQRSKFAITQYIKKEVNNIFDKWFTQWKTLKAAITQIAMEIQLWKFPMTQYIKK